MILNTMNVGFSPPDGSWTLYGLDFGRTGLKIYLIHQEKDVKK